MRERGPTQEKTNPAPAPRHAVAARKIIGGPAPETAAAQIEVQRETLALEAAWVNERETALSRAFEDLVLEARRFAE